MQLKQAIAPLFDTVSRWVTLSELTRHALLDIASLHTVARKSLLEEPGRISMHRNYIVMGLFRSYFMDDRGKEHTVQIAPEDHFTSDFQSYILRQPSNLYVEALEESTIVQFHYDAIEPLIREHLDLCEYFRRTTERAFATSRERALSNLYMNAEERYNALIDRFPHYEQRIPQRILASYLGITPEAFSRMKAARSQ